MISNDVLRKVYITPNLCFIRERLGCEHGYRTGQLSRITSECAILAQNELAVLRRWGSLTRRLLPSQNTTLGNHLRYARNTHYYFKVITMISFHKGITWTNIKLNNSHVIMINRNSAAFNPTVIEIFLMSKENGNHSS